MLTQLTYPCQRTAGEQVQASRVDVLTPAKQQHYSHAHKTTTLQPRPQNNNTTATPTKQQHYSHAGKHASY